jgi:hypothetical protein
MRSFEFHPKETILTYSETHLRLIQPILSLPEFDVLISNRPPKEQLPVKQLEVLPEKDNGVYAKKFAEGKGSTHGMTERLRLLFPPHALLMIHFFRQDSCLNTAAPFERAHS